MSTLKTSLALVDQPLHIPENIWIATAQRARLFSGLQLLHSLLFIITFIDCNCPKAKPRSDGKLVVDAICDKIGECMCPTIADAGEVTLTDSGCVVGGMLLLTLEVHVSKLPV